MLSNRSHVRITNIGNRISAPKVYFICIINFIAMCSFISIINTTLDDQGPTTLGSTTPQFVLISLLILSIINIGSFLLGIQNPIFPEEFQIMVLIWLSYSIIIHGGISCQNSCTLTTLNVMDIMYSILWISLTIICYFISLRYWFSLSRSAKYTKTIICIFILVLFIIPVRCNNLKNEPNFVSILKYFCYFSLCIIQRYVDIIEKEIVCRNDILKHVYKKDGKTEKKKLVINSWPLILYTTTKCLWCLSICNQFLPLVALQFGYLMFTWYKSCKILHKQTKLLLNKGIPNV